MNDSYQAVPTGPTNPAQPGRTPSTGSRASGGKSKLQEFREQHPAYKDVPDEKLAPALHKKFYAKLPADEFYAKIGFTPAAPEEGPGLIERGRAALGNIRESLQPSSAAGFLGVENVGSTPATLEASTEAPVAPQRPKLDSVMVDAALKNRGGAPVSQQSRDSIRTFYDRASPEERAKLAARQDWMGQIARDLEASYSRTEDLPTAQTFDNRHEAIATRARGAGADRDTAESIATGGDTRPVATAGETPEMLSDRLARMAVEQTDMEPARAIVKGAVDLAGSVAKVADSILHDQAVQRHDLAD